MQGGTFGAAVDAKDNAWLTSYGGKSIAVFDKNGKPLTPPEGITFDGKLGLMQGVIVTPSGDVWARGMSKEPTRLFSQGRSGPRAGSFARGASAEPCKSFLGPFHLGIDQQDRIWVTNAFGDHVTRFPASDPSKVEKFEDRLERQRPRHRQPGQCLGDQPARQLDARRASIVEDMIAALKTGGNADEALTRAMAKQTRRLRRRQRHAAAAGRQRSIPARRSRAAVSPAHGRRSWTATTTSGFPTSPLPNSPIAQLCGVRTENCPPGMKTGDQISPPGGYVGGGLQMQTDLAIGPAGDVWVMNNWQDIDSCFGVPAEALSTRCGGQGVTIFFGMAKPVRAPQIGPARPAD